jgi:transposase
VISLSLPAEPLAPVLAPGDVVVLDNLAAHKVDGVRQAIAAAAASILYLPPYSPDLNPIEQLFAKLKALLRKAATRTRDELWTTIGRLLAIPPPGECANYLSHCSATPHASSPADPRRWGWCAAGCAPDTSGSLRARSSADLPQGGGVAGDVDLTVQVLRVAREPRQLEVDQAEHDLRRGNPGAERQ